MMEVLKDHWGQKEAFKHQLSQDKSKFELWVDCFRSMTFSGSWKSFFGAQVCASLIGSWLNCIFTFLLLFFRMLLRWKLIRPMRVSLSRWRNSERRTAEKTEASLAEELSGAAAGLWKSICSDRKHPHFLLLHQVSTNAEAAAGGRGLFLKCCVF